jgi:hypothetical protein
MTDLTLTPAQEQQVVDLWNANPETPPALKDLTISVFGDGHDGRTNEAKAIKKFLSSRNLKAQTTSEYQRVSDLIELSDEQKLYIANNVQSMNSAQISRVLFNNPNLSNLAAEALAVNKYIKTLNIRVRHAEDMDIPDGKYFPPKTPEAVLRVVNRYINPPMEQDKLTAAWKKNLDTLIGYMHTYRYTAQMNNYESVSDRSLCEDAFVRATYDKPDLAQTEVDQYIEYANQVVEGFKIQRRKEILQHQQEEMADASDPDSRKYCMGLVEAIGKASTEFNLCKKREQDLLDTLSVSRSERISKQREGASSILDLVNHWKTEEGRKEWLKHAEKEQEAMKTEVARLSSLPDFKARILGLSKEGIING